MSRVDNDVERGVRRTDRDDPERLLKEDRNMTDPNTDDVTRTWEQMEVPERDPNVDPFTYFTGDGPGDHLDI